MIECIEFVLCYIERRFTPKKGSLLPFFSGGGVAVTLLLKGCNYISMVY